MVGLVIGRFQPFHSGHLKMVEYVYKWEKSVIVGIGSAQNSHTIDDPFTAGERYEMIYKTLKRDNIDHFYIIPIEDIYRNSLWVEHVRSFVPRFDVVYSNNPLTKRLFSEASIKVEEYPMYKRRVCTGKRIRKLMLEGDDWQRYVPESIAEFITKMGGIKRIKEIAGSDEVED